MLVDDIAVPPASLLYVPAHKPKMIEKARQSDADIIILDLEDAVPDAKKDIARDAVRQVLSGRCGDKRVAVRINSGERGEGDLDVLQAAPPDYIVVPKVSRTADLPGEPPAPLLAMIETPAAILGAAAIAADRRVAGLIAGLNDLSHDLRLPHGVDRNALSLSLQMIVLVARAHDRWCFDGVYNAIDDEDAFVAEAEAGHRLGFDGKSLIHPAQIALCNAVWAPSAGAVDEARRIVALAGTGAQRFEDRMIEDMHIVAARRTIARADVNAGLKGRRACATRTR